jgi:hypothetical protein
MKETIDNFINSIDSNIYNKLRKSMSDAECRRYMKNHLEKYLINVDSNGFIKYCGGCEHETEHRIIHACLLCDGHL